VIAATLPVDDDRRHALSRVQQQIGRLGVLVGDLLNFARPMTAQFQPVDLFAIAEMAVKDAGASGEARLATVEGKGAAIADNALLSQVLLNLVQNAWQAGAQHVTLRVSPGAIDVVDDGPGISAAHRGTVFEPFFTTKVRGTGLGLPVARKMLEAMRGTLELTSTSTVPPTGTTFAVRVPPLVLPTST
jgi:signal transduction histidine kinase